MFGLRRFAKRTLSRRAGTFLFFRHALYHEGFYRGYNLPKTPDGRNPYAVFDIDPTTSTRRSIHKRFRQLVVNNHPDRGGSNAQMLEINAAYAILRQHHDKYRLTLEQNTAPSTSNGNEAYEYEQLKRHRSENVQRSGGVHASTNVDPIHSFEQYKKVTTERANIMINRYAFACTQGIWMRKHKCLIQLIARERWLVKGFLSTVRNDLHEHKAHLKNLDETVDEIDAFGKHIEETLENAFSNTTKKTRRKMMAQNFIRFMNIGIGLIFLYTLFDRTIYEKFVRNSVTVKYAPYFK